MNRSVNRGLFFGAGFGCAYALVVLLLGGSSSPGLAIFSGLGGALVVLLLGGSSGPGLAIFSGLGGALVGAVSDCIIAVLTLGIGQLTRIRRDLEKAIAAVIAGT